MGAGTHQGGVYHPRYRVEDSRTECLPDRRKACLSLGLYPRASTMGIGRPSPRPPWNRVSGSDELIACEQHASFSG